METSRPTSHSAPVYEAEGVIHYCVTNMPGAVPHTSTEALCNTTLPYISQIANLGTIKALERNQALALGLNTFEGRLTNSAVAEALGLISVPLGEVLQAK